LENARAQSFSNLMDNFLSRKKIKDFQQMRFFLFSIKQLLSLFA